MTEPLFWLGLSILLVAISLTALLAVAIPAFKELAQAGRSVQKLADTLSRELPPTLEAIRLTGLEISELSDELTQGAKNAGDAVKQVNDGIKGVKEKAQNVGIQTKSTLAGIKAGWQAFRKPKRRNPLSKINNEKTSPLELRSGDLDQNHLEDKNLPQNDPDLDSLPISDQKES
jgi:hypothetical protein